MRLSMIEAITSGFDASKVRTATEAYVVPGTRIEASAGTFGPRVITSDTGNGIAEYAAGAARLER